MKLYDFGLWFGYWNSTGYVWSTTIRPEGGYDIYFDGNHIAHQYGDFNLARYYDMPYCLSLKKETEFRFNKILTLDDFEIVENSKYRGTR